MNEIIALFFIFNAIKWYVKPWDMRRNARAKAYVELLRHQVKIQIAAQSVSKNIKTKYFKRKRDWFEYYKSTENDTHFIICNMIHDRVRLIWNDECSHLFHLFKMKQE